MRLNLGDQIKHNIVKHRVWDVIRGIDVNLATHTIIDEVDDSVWEAGFRPVSHSLTEEMVTDESRLR